MRIFSCFPFAFNPSRIGDKIPPKGVPCVFHGYPATEKGYKLLNNLTRHAFVSMSVAFQKHIFPYKDSSCNKYPHPIHMSLLGVATWTDDF